MSDTPRTEAEVNRQKCWSDDLITIDANFACQLERELNAANQRIKRLEEMYEGVIGEKPELLGSNVMGLLKRELNFAQNRIKQLEEELMEVKNKHSVLVADVALDEDRADRIHRLEDRIHRAAMAFFRDGSDGHVASQMLQILEEERGKK